jgi:hypothetical protein
MRKQGQAPLIKAARYGLLAGLAGGVAEIVWIALYGSLTAIDTTEVARAISATSGWLFPGIPLGASPIVRGILIHMIAAVGLGVALAIGWRSLTAHTSLQIHPYSFMVGALATVWVFNFFVLLPLIGAVVPGLQHTFVELLPYPVSLASKILFGLAGAAVLRDDAERRQASRVRVRAGAGGFPL